MTKNKYFKLISISIIRGFAGPVINGSAGLFFSSVSNELNTPLSSQTTYLAISSLSALISLILIGKFSEYINLKLLCLISGVLQAISFISLGLVNNIFFFYILAIPLGLGVAVLVNIASPIIVNSNFKKRKGVIMGLVLCITSTVGGISNPIITYIIKEFGYRYAYFIFGGISLIAYIFLGIFIENKKLYNSKNEKFKKDKIFYMISIFVLVITAFVSFSQHIATLGEKNGFDIQSMGLCLSLCMFGSAVGAFIIGCLSDKINPIITGIIVCISCIIIMCLFLFFSNSYIILCIASFLNGISMSSLGVLPPLLIQTSYKDNYSKALSYITCANPLGVIIFMPLYGFIFDFTQNYNYVISIIIICMIIGLICLFKIKKSSET